MEFASSSCLIIVFPPGSTSSAISEEIDVLEEPSWVITVVPCDNSDSESFEKTGSSLRLSRSHWWIS